MKKMLENFYIDIKNKLNLQCFEDWNSITRSQIQLFGGGTLFNKYSIFDLKCLGFPEGKDKFNPPNKVGYWQDKQKILDFLRNLGEKLKLKSLEDWHSLTAKQIQSFGGSSLLTKYSLYDIKCLAFPSGKDFFEKPIHPKSVGYWKENQNVISFLNELRTKYNLISPKDWNMITKNHVQALGGVSLLRNYLIFELKCLGCPEGKMVFDKPAGYWDDDKNIEEFTDLLKETYNLQTPQDWSRLSKKQIISLGGDGLAKKISLQKFIREQNPEEKIEYSNNTKSSQRWLFLQIQKLFPNEEIVEDYYHSEISRDTGFSVQFDIFLIHKGIAFEYHGKQHYEDMPFAFSPIELYQSRDNEKIKLCKQYGIHLIIIPYWWDNQLESLLATIESKCDIKIKNF